MSLTIKSSFLSAALLISINDAYALGAVSRACQFSTLNTAQQIVAAPFFVAMGAPTNILTLPGKSTSEQQKYWVRESITTDYGRVRYFLYAQSASYTYNYNNSRYELFASYSSGWAAEQVAEYLQLDPNFSKFYANRGLLYSARAGRSEIITPDGNFTFGVAGKHIYYDPVSKNVVALADTFATDCNLSNWGVGLFDR